MESLEAISAMNDKHPPGRRSTSITDLVARVKELEKELSEAHENTHQATPAPRSATEVSTLDIEGVRRTAQEGLLITPAFVLALCDRIEALEGAIIRALAACPFCQQGECRAEAHQWLRSALSVDTSAPLLSLLTYARAWAGAITRGELGDLDRLDGELLEAVLKCK